ncbi:MAG: feruloyl-CoA synthase [Acidimicrobiales bacterium]
MPEPVMPGPIVHRPTVPGEPLFAPPHVTRHDRPGGIVMVESTDSLGEYPVSVASMLRSWAAAGSDHPLVAERGPDGRWVQRTYGEVLAAADAVGQALLDRGLSAERPLLVLSGNSIGHLVVSLAAMTVGVPAAPASVAYSLQSRDHERVRQIGDLVRPGAVYVEDAAAFAPAVEALGVDLPVISVAGGPGEHSLEALCATKPGRAVEQAFAAVDGDTVAKILFTSGSTGAPKGVVTTNRMLCCNQQMISQAWPFLEQERPVLVDWLPWSHTFGGSHNVGIVLANGGTVYIDEGRPAPNLFARTLANYRDVPPTISFNVPAGYAQLVPALEADRELAERFFSRMRLVFNAAAALPSPLRRRLEDLGRDVTGRDVPVTGSWGTTETAPAATSAHFDFDDARCIGVPLAGVSLKLVPAEGDTYEIRVRGPNITPGYYQHPDFAGEAFDDEGYYRPGDAVSFADQDDPNAGVVFRGRLAEDFKLSTGTFVHVGAVRTALLSAAPVLSDAVIAGADRDEVCALAWLNPAEVARVIGEQPEVAGEVDVVESEALVAHLGATLEALNSGAGSSARVERLVLMAQPASLDAGEITDKGYVNQRQVLATRVALVEMLYSDPPPPGVITAKR